MLADMSRGNELITHNGKQEQQLGGGFPGLVAFWLYSMNSDPDVVTTLPGQDW